MTKPSGPENRRVAAELIRAAEEELARQKANHVRPDWEREKQLRDQINAIDRRRDRPRPEDPERMRELTREHHRRTGASGRGG